MLLGRDGERCELLVVVLNLKRCAVRDKRAIRQTDAEGRTDLGTFDSEAVVVLTVHVAGNHKVILQANVQPSSLLLDPPLSGLLHVTMQSRLSLHPIARGCALRTAWSYGFRLVVTPYSDEGKRRRFYVCLSDNSYTTPEIPKEIHFYEARGKSLFRCRNKVWLFS